MNYMTINNDKTYFNYSGPKCELPNDIPDTVEILNCSCCNLYKLTNIFPKILNF